MHQFYDKIELHSIVAASKEVLDYLPIAGKSGDTPYPDRIQIAILLLTSQVRKMFQFKSIDPKSITDAQLIAFTHEYMREMSNQRKATSAITKSTMENRSKDVRGTVETNRMPPKDKTIGTALPNNATNTSAPSYPKNVSWHSRTKAATELENNSPAAAPALVTIEIDSTSSETEIESDDEVEYIRTVRPDGAKK